MILLFCLFVLFAVQVGLSIGVAIEVEKRQYGSAALLATFTMIPAVAIGVSLGIRVTQVLT